MNVVFAGDTNLYSYCGNNPVMNVDQSGYYYVEGIEIGDYDRPIVVDSIVDLIRVLVRNRQEELSKESWTYTLGNTVGGFCGVGTSFTEGFTIDSQGNIVFQYTISLGASLRASYFGGLYFAETNSPNYQNLEGLGLQLGGSMSVNKFGGGFDFNFCLDKPYKGMSSTFGLGAGAFPFEMHIELTYTFTNPIKINMYDVIYWILDQLEE